jgi:predicted Holliday junction resolvase-like endonuclease
MALFLFSIGAATLAILAVMVISLFRQVRRLSGALQDFSKDVTPALQDIQREGDRSQVLAERIEQRQREREEETRGSRRARPQRRRGTR